MATKKTIRCKNCENRVEWITCTGFIRETKLSCAYFDMEVDPNDGCTFGKEGEKRYSSKRTVNVDISGDSATEGDSRYPYRW